MAHGLERRDQAGVAGEVAGDPPGNEPAGDRLATGVEVEVDPHDQHIAIEPPSDLLVVLRAPDFFSAIAAPMLWRLPAARPADGNAAVNAALLSTCLVASSVNVTCLIL